MNEFEFDEEIELSDLGDFSKNVLRGKFRHQNPNSGSYWAADRHGYMFNSTFARKIEPKVMIVLYGEGSRAQTRQIPQSLADKILAREV
jgi:hypothetical protein